MTETVIRKEWKENFKALIRQRIPIALKAVKDYEAGKSLEAIEADEELVTFLRGHGTRIEAAKLMLQEHYEQHKPARKTKRKADKEVK